MSEDQSIPESWRPVPGYEGSYEVSDLGRVRSVDRAVLNQRGTTMHFKGRLLRPAANTHGYLQVMLARATPGEPHQKPFVVHRLVLSAFAGPRPTGAVTRHLNGDKSDNRLANLSYGTQSENISDKRRHGTDHNLNKTQCPQGHSYDGDNVRLDHRGHRYCRVCRQAQRKAVSA